MSERFRPGVPHNNTAHHEVGYGYPGAFPRPRLAVSEAAQRAGNMVGMDRASQEAFINRKLALLTLRQAQLDAALGRTYDRDDNLYRSFSIAKHVVNLELSRDRESTLQGMDRDIKTNAIERVRADTVPLKYKIRDGQLFAVLSETDSIAQAKIAQEPVRLMIKTGIADRLGHDTLEGEREQAELDGWDEFEPIIVDPTTEVGTTYTFLSPQSSITKEGKKGAYDKNFVNKFTLKEQDGERYVELIQRDVDFDDEGYRKAALLLDTQAFDEYDQMEKKPPLDAYLLKRVFKGSLPEALTEKKRMTLSLFENNIYNDNLLQQMVRYYKEGLTEAVDTQNYDWRDLCIRFNAILNRTDTLMERIGKNQSEITSGFQIFPQLPPQEPIAYNFVRQLVQEIGQRTPQVVGGGGCPTNKGYDVGEGSMGSSPYRGSVGQHSKEGGKCSDCNASAADNHYHCPGCTKTYADETAKAAEDMTQKCGCGFEFDCGKPAGGKGPEVQASVSEKGDKASLTLAA